MRTRISGKRGLAAVLVSASVAAATLGFAGAGVASAADVPCPGDGTPYLAGNLSGDLVACLVGPTPLPAMDPLNVNNLRAILEAAKPIVSQLPAYVNPPSPPVGPRGPEVCKRVEQTWTNDQGTINRISQRNGVPVVEVNLSVHWTEGFAKGGRSEAPLDITLNEKGDLIHMGREVYEGTWFEQLNGSAVNWNWGPISPNGTYQGSLRSIAAYDGLEGAHFESNYFGTLAVGGRMVDPVVCFDEGSEGAKVFEAQVDSFPREGNEFTPKFAEAEYVN